MAIVNQTDEYAKKLEILPMDTVLFDGECMLCRSLAAYAERRASGAMRFISWQKYYAAVEVPQGASDVKMSKNDAVELRVVKAGSESIPEVVLDGAAAWSYLLAAFPDLAGLNWLAERLRIQEPTAMILNSAGSVARRLCLRCRRPVFSRSD